MSIRAKILSILISALCLAFTVSALAYLHVVEMERQVDGIVDLRLPTVSAAREVRGDVLLIQEAEQRMISSDDATHLRGVEEIFIRLEKTIERGQDHTREEALKSRWMEMSRQLAALRTNERRLAELINNDVRDISGLQRALKPRMESLAGRLRDWKVEGGPEDEPLKRLALEAADVLEDLVQVRYSASQRALFDEALYRHLTWRLTRGLRARLERLAEASGGLRVGVRGFGALNDTGVDDLLFDLEDLDAQITDVNDRLIALTEETRLTRERLLKLSTLAEREHWELIEASRRDISDSSASSGLFILVFLSLGVIIVAALAFIFMRSLTKSVGRLLSASRRLRQGDLEARVEIEGRDELQELGSSFNTMAQYLQTRRQRQNDYNEIVTALNSTIGLMRTLESSLSDVVRRTGSDLGGIYLFDPETQLLELAHAHALSGKSAGEGPLRLGQGVVGQVGLSRKLAFVQPVPEGLFELHLGIGRAQPACLIVQPLVHLDVLLGVIVLGSTRVYSMDDITFIEEVVFQLAVSISNARFYEKIEDAAAEMRDINEKLMLQQVEMGMINSKLAEANQLKSEFLANVTHELRTPLNAILGYTELVLDGEEVQGRGRRNLETVMRNADNLLRLINDLLDVSKMESGQVSLRVDAFDLNELVGEVIEMTAPMVRGKALEVRRAGAEGVLLVSSDRLKCKQILVNLVSNAIKFTETGSVLVETARVGDSVEIHVRDSGIGIRPEDLHVIFEKFRQLDGSTSRKYGGAGLGLAITQRLCEFLKGEVKAASVPGEGSTFSVRLPMRLSEGEVGGGVGGEAGVGKEVEGLGKPVLLVIDDDPGTVVTLREGLMGVGVEVRSAFTGRDAVDILREMKPAGVVIGATLPEIDGAESMSRVWELIKEQRISVLLIWQGEGEMPTYGYPPHGRVSLGDLSVTKMSRVLGCLKRPVNSVDVMDLLVESKIIGSGVDISREGSA